MGKIIKILDVFPDIYMEEFRGALADRESLSKQLEEETNGIVKLETVFIDKGNASIENSYDEALAAPYILQKVKWAQENGYSAVVSDGILDVALDAARELVYIPVLGAGQAAFSLATQLGGRFSVITIVPDLERPLRANIAKYGLSQNLVSIHMVDTPVLDLQDNFEKVTQKLVELAERAVVEGARAVTLGCTGMSPLIEIVRRELKNKGMAVPLIEPLRAAICTAVACVLLGVSHSKEAYRPVRSKHRLLDWTP